MTIYDIDCLPTWNEIYNEFYLNKIFTYESSKHKELDTYWQRPRRKILLAFICNQLNKMIFEDKVIFTNDHNKKLIQYIDVRFMLDSKSIDIDFDNKFNLNATLENDPPKIYRCKLPSTNEYSIHKSDYHFIDIDDLDDITLGLQLYTGYSFYHIYHPDMKFNEVLKIILENVTTRYMDIKK